MRFLLFRSYHQPHTTLGTRTRLLLLIGRNRRTLSTTQGWYSRKLDTHPILTKSLTSGLIAGMGDALCQYYASCHGIVGKKNNDDAACEYDIWRTLRFALLGTMLVGPVCHGWYGLLASRLPGTSAYPVAKRVALDQFLFSPVFLTGWLSCLWTLEGRNQYDYGSVPSIVVANWALWIPAQVLNFRFVPVKYQVLCSNAVALLWNVYLSFTTHQERAATNKKGQTMGH